MQEKNEGKILHIGEIPFPLPWDLWYKKIETLRDWTIQRESWETFQGNIEALKSFDYVRVSRNLAARAFSLFHASAPLITQIQYVDLIFCKNGILWPCLNHKEAIRSVILERQPFLNINASGLIIGVSKEAILAAVVLVEFGIRQITFVVENEIEGQGVLKVLRRIFFEIQFEAISKDKVILLPGIYSVVICYDDLRAQVDLVTALLYFNYLERGGLVINAGCLLGEIPLLEEALAIGAKVVDLTEIQVHEEIVALQKIVSFDQASLKKMLALVTSS